MFGVVRLCRRRLCGPFFGEWTAHLCFVILSPLYKVTGADV
jgi:hypothetical protein